MARSYPARTRKTAAGLSRVQDLLASLLLVALSLVCFFPVFQGRVLVPWDGAYFFDQALARHRPPSVVAPINTAPAHDQIYMMYVWRQFTAHSLAADRMPLWNPYSACGLPLLANDQSAVLQPANFLLNLLLPPASAQTVFALLCLIGACLFTYGLTRSLGGNPVGGALAGLTFGLGGFVMIWLGYPIAATAVWLPALLWATHAAAQRPRPLTAMAIGAVIGCQFLSGHVSTSVQMLAFWVVFAVWQVMRRPRCAPARWARRYAIVLAGGLLLGTGLGAPQLLPTQEYYRQSAVSHAGGRNRWASASLAETVRQSLLGDWWFLRSLAAEEAALLLTPERHGNPALGDYHVFAGYGGYSERTSYPGMVALVFLVASLLPRPREGPVRFFAFAACVLFGILLHLPVLNSAIYLPVLNLTGPSRLRFVFTLCAAVVLGLSVTEWANRPQRAPGRALAWLIPALLALLSGALAAGALPTLAPHFHTLTKPLLLLRLTKLFSPAMVALMLALLFLFAGRLRRAVALVILVLLAAADLLLFASRWHPMAERERILPPLPEIAQVRQIIADGRLAGPPDFLAPNLTTAYEVDDARGNDPLVLERYVALVHALTGKPRDMTMSLVRGWDTSFPQLNRLTSVRAQWSWSQREGWHLVPFEEGLPRAYVATRIRFLPREDVLRALARGADPWRLTLIESSSPSSEGSPGRIHPAEITHYRPHRVVVSAIASDPSWLVLTDNAYPGWRAQVNGHAVPIAVANGTFRAVPIPAGRSTVEFTYRPGAYAVGLFLGLVSLALTIAIAAASIPARLSARPPRPR